MFLRRARLEVLKDLQHLLSIEENDVARAQLQSREIARYLGETKNRISKRQCKSKEFFRTVVGNLLAEAQGDVVKSGEAPKELESAKQALSWITSELFDGGANAGAIDHAVKLIRKDPTVLQTLVRNHAPADRQANFIHWIKKLSWMSGVEFLGGLESQSEDDGPPIKRAQELFSRPPVSRPVLFVINGRQHLASLMPSRQSGLLLFRMRGQEGKGAYIAVNSSGDVSLRVNGRLVTQAFSEKATGGNTFFRRRTDITTP